MNLPFVTRYPLLNGRPHELPDTVASDGSAAPQGLYTGPLFPACLGNRLELCETAGNRRQVEPIGFDNATLGPPPTVPLAIGAILHQDQTEFDQVAIEVLYLARPQAHLLLLYRRGW